ncbi:glycoside hydrolase [Pseudovirgaria hyperparasitica]|uniref:Beta-xylanase n=1 Tax=Pseudovirgaria hyperparasitica TaxID=470096 RepID=A0A6A6W5W8_9PEZI|nr:glycoside hydrolase [Pseudovirgaria hyperparasitica]KAF2757945.1 glycoside hydrolase [Pseudovirgaria hyperparasitica]
MKWTSFALAIAFTPAVLSSLLADRGSKEIGLNQLARKAGLQYFGTAIDNPSLAPGGASYLPYSIDNSKYRKVAYNSEEFGQVTPANGLKWMFTEPSRGQFNYTLSDEIIKPAIKNGQFRRCHALVWHNQLPPWLTSQTWTASELLSVVRTHIAAEVTHYKGQCLHWDVVNEAFNEDGTFRPSIFYNITGTGYIYEAFAAAAKADPKAKLYYNDYNIETVGPKSDSVRTLVKEMRKKGVKIDGVGLQSHFTVGGTPSYEAQTANMAAFTKMDLDVAVTELDVRMQLPSNGMKLAQQAKDYNTSVMACKNTKRCVGITVWDFQDNFSWVPSTFAGEGDPLPYSSTTEKKPAWYTIAKALRG